MAESICLCWVGNLLVRAVRCCSEDPDGGLSAVDRPALERSRTALRKKPRE